MPAQYHEFAEVFGEEQFKELPPHRPYDIKIEFIEGAKPKHGPLYSMTDAESVILKEFLEKLHALHYPGFKT